MLYTGGMRATSHVFPRGSLPHEPEKNALLLLDSAEF